MQDVATFVDTVLFEPFDADIAINAMKSSSRWTDHRLYGKSDDEIKKQWANGRKYGIEMKETLLRELAEFYSGTENCKYNKFYSQMSAFSKYHARLAVYKLKWELTDEALQLTTSVDAAYKNTAGNLVLVKWIHTGLYKKSNKFQKGTHTATAALDNCDYVKASLELSFAKRMAQAQGYEVDELFIVTIFYKKASVYKKHIVEDYHSDIVEDICTGLVN